MLKTVRDPVLPIVPTVKEVKEPERLVRWWKALLTVIVEWHENTYDDLTQLQDLPAHADNAAAVAGGIAVGGFYRTGGDPDLICVVH